MHWLAEFHLRRQKQIQNGHISQHGNLWVSLPIQIHDVISLERRTHS